MRRGYRGIQGALIFFLLLLTLANRRLIIPVRRRPLAKEPRRSARQIAGILSVRNRMWDGKMSQTDKMALFGSALLLIAIVGLGLYGLNRSYSYADEGPTDISAQSRR